MGQSRWEQIKEKISEAANSRPASWATSAGFGASVASAAMYVKDSLTCCLPTACASTQPLGLFCLGSTFLFSSCLHSQRTAATDQRVLTLEKRLDAQKRHQKTQDQKMATLDHQLSELQFKQDQHYKVLENIAKILGSDGDERDKNKKVAEILPPKKEEYQIRIFTGVKKEASAAKLGLFKTNVTSPGVQRMDDKVMRKYEAEYEASRKSGVTSDDKITAKTPLLGNRH